jgi:regulator of sirC expression with transglutaminase-like and TPR domain
MNMPSPAAPAPQPRFVVRSIAAVLFAPEEELDYAKSKVALDLLIDPSMDAAWTLRELDRLARCAAALAGKGASDAERVQAVRTVIYRSGRWIGNRCFDYDHEGYKDPRVGLLAHYLSTRRGNCVSMPILFLILGDKLGIDVSLAMAAGHLFIRWRSGKGEVVNLETTSGANPSRDAWYL